VLLLLLTMTLCCSALSSQFLKGKKVLVTGGGRGIGRAIALICHDEGADVIVTSRTQNELEETVRLAHGSFASNEKEGEGDGDDEEKQRRLKQSAMAATLLARRGGRSTSRASGKTTSVGARRTGTATKARMGRSSVSQLVNAVKTGSSSIANSGSGSDDDDDDDDSSSCDSNRMTYQVCDVTNESQVDSMIQEIVGGNDGEGGDIDILINNAGGAQFPKGPVGTLENQDLENLLKLNVVAPQLVTSAVCKHASSWNSESKEDTAEPSEQKVILNISSKAGKVGLQNYSFYVATKFALEGLTSSWAKELAPRNIRVHSLSPGMVNTQSFPKPPGKKGVREAASIRDCLLLALTGRIAVEDADGETIRNTNVVEDMMEYTGHYIHVDEYDQVVNEKGVEKAHLAWKAIDEDPFRV
jgi:NAD(P)-dependent dehydrogenase (short-subunit alcohol dehydrogenase family)